MRHKRGYKRFGLPSDQRKALLKGLTRSLLMHDHITTTEVRAKQVRPIVERLVTIARKGSPAATVPEQVHARRLVRRYVDSNVRKFIEDPEQRGPKGGAKPAHNPEYVTARLFDVIAPRYMDRPGGYTRIIHVGLRRGDAAPIVMLEFVEEAATADTTARAPKKSGRKVAAGQG